jgi:hypothetical protein
LPENKIFIEEENNDAAHGSDRDDIDSACGIRMQRQPGNGRLEGKGRLPFKPERGA